MTNFALVIAFHTVCVYTVPREQTQHQPTVLWYLVRCCLLYGVHPVPTRLQRRTAACSFGRADLFSGLLMPCRYCPYRGIPDHILLCRGTDVLAVRGSYWDDVRVCIYDALYGVLSPNCDSPKTTSIACLPYSRMDTYRVAVSTYVVPAAFILMLLFVTRLPFVTAYRR
ncbi:hypothetical protein NPIL_342911 [Nephila pilipes]|uniref:Uncharacterized protein n=1 Tax=Nephila pilipes TaxID=299642 RepID=A0A8X6NXI5_NEPPI|nr:hypothetical protein NPIL_342911 [Nephila pilipes]